MVLGPTKIYPMARNIEDKIPGIRCKLRALGNRPNYRNLKPRVVGPYTFFKGTIKVPIPMRPREEFNKQNIVGMMIIIHRQRLEPGYTFVRRIMDWAPRYEWVIVKDNIFNVPSDNLWDNIWFRIKGLFK